MTDPHMRQLEAAVDAAERLARAGRKLAKLLRAARGDERHLVTVDFVDRIDVLSGELAKDSAIIMDWLAGFARRQRSPLARLGRKESSVNGPRVN